MNRAGVLVTASFAARAQAERKGLDRVETRIEDAIVAGRSRRWTLTGERLEGNFRHVVVTDRVGAIVAKDGWTGGGRQRYRAIRLIDLPGLPGRGLTRTPLRKRQAPGRPPVNVGPSPDGDPS